ncbi:MAG: Ig-like domain-containing protein [Muribaculaceae bacterium]|nr:Ig-like domain-containing protein [Muribaculaceae bacterium]
MNRGLTTMRIISKGLQITPTDGFQHGTNIGKSLLKYKSTYQGINWDFTNDWTIQETESLPYKSVQCAPPTINSATSGATTVTGNCVSGGAVYVSVAGKHYTAQVSGNTWTATVDPLQSGATVRAFATTSDKIQSYMVSTIVGYAGEGTEASPYLIYTASDLANINSYSYYKVMNDIDLTDWINANSPTTGWIPVGASGGGTMKQLDGNGKTITGLWFNRSNSNSGLISAIENATVKNLTVKTASGKNSKGADYRGILVGKASNSQLTGIKVEGLVEGLSYVGGIAGDATGTSITSCVATSVTASGSSYVGGVTGYTTMAVDSINVTNTTVSGTGDYVGGIAGEIKNSASECSVQASISGNNYTGGIVGEISGDVTNCSTDIELTGANYIGGITGHTEGEISLSTAKGYVTTTDTVNCRAGGIVAVASGNIINCYSSATINGGLYSGGIVGYTSAKVDNCYSCGNISAMTYGAGVAGYLDGANAAVSHCFAINEHIDVSDQVGVAMRVIGGFKNGAATPDTTNFANKAMVVSVNGVTQVIYDDILEGKGVQLAALKQQATYTAQGWDFDNVWAIKEGEGFPYFRHLVEKVPVTSITLNKSADKLIVGGNLALIATVAPSDATIKTVNWTSDNVDVATVNEDGLVTAVAVGTATITATATDGSNVSASCSVEVIKNQNEEIAALNQLVASAEELYNNSTEGENIGQYAPGSRAALLEVILDVKARISATMTTEEITECTNALNAAIELFESKKVTTTADTDISAYENIIYVEKAEASVGSTVTLSLKMNNNREVVGFQCDFYAPEGTEIAVDADGFEEINLSTERTTSKRTDFFGSATQQDGAMRILAASTSLLPFLGNEGEIATIKLNIGSDMEDGDYPLIIRNTVFSDADGNTFKVNYVKTTLKISSYTLGDANGDGEINIGDFTAIANYILGHPKDSFVLQAADTNQDGEITVGDLSKLIKLILNSGTSSAPTQAAPKAAKVVLCDSVIY